MQVTAAMLAFTVVGAVRIPPSHSPALAGDNCVSLPSRRFVLAASIGLSAPALAEADTGVIAIADPNGRKRREGDPSRVYQRDYWYVYNIVPPRNFNPAAESKQPQWNAWGSCVENSCTYVPLKQRYEAYNKYAGRLESGLRAFRFLGDALRNGQLEKAVAATDRGDSARPPALAVDALLKAALMANLLLVSPNNLREVQESSLAAFYVNEASFALQQIAKAAREGDPELALQYWTFGQDSWNSYLRIVNRAVVEKVGDKFELI